MPQILKFSTSTFIFKHSCITITYKIPFLPKVRFCTYLLGGKRNKIKSNIEIQVFEPLKSPVLNKPLFHHINPGIYYQFQALKHSKLSYKPLKITKESVKHRINFYKIPLKSFVFKNHHELSSHIET